MCCGEPARKSTISVAMIVRDAEATLEVALKSVASRVSEIVIVDTGSRDSTLDIAARYTSEIFHFDWCDDFSAARQYAHDLCASEWVFFLDADDEVFGASHLFAAVANAPEHLDALMIRYVTARDERGKPITEFYRERLVRKDRMRWEGRVHEAMVPIAGTCAYERFDPTWVFHHGHGDGHSSLERNIRLLRMDLADKPGDTRTMFYLGRELIQVGELELGMEQLEAYQAVSSWADERFIALSLIGHALRLQHKWLEAYTSDLRLQLVYPLWPQSWFALAQDCYYLGLWPECVHYTEIGQGLPMPQSNLFMNPTDVESGWMIFAAVALWRVGKVEQACELTIRALTLRPNDPQHQQNAIFFRQQLEDQIRQRETVSAH